MKNNTTFRKLPLLIFAACILTSMTGIAAAQDGGLQNEIEQQAYQPPFEISFSGSVAIGPNDTWLWETGFGFSYLVSQDIRVGVEQLGYASTSLLSGSRDAVSIAPMVEYSMPINKTPVELSFGAGVPLQVRFGADLNTKLGVAPFVRAGIDFRTSELFSFGFIERISYVLSDGYIMSEHGLPSGAAIFATGFAVKFHF